MASVSALRDGLRTRLETITGLRAYDTVPGSVTPPVAVVYPSGGAFLRFDSTFGRGSDDLTFVVLLLTSTASDRGGQDSLDAYLAGSGALSIKTAIEGDPTLGGIAQFLQVTEARNYGTTNVGGIDYYSCEFAITVGV